MEREGSVRSEFDSSPPSSLQHMESQYYQIESLGRRESDSSIDVMLVATDDYWKSTTAAL